MASSNATPPSHRHVSSRPTASANATTAWLLGKDQSSAGGQSAIGSTSSTRHGLRSSTSPLATRLMPYASAAPTGVSTTSAMFSADLPRARQAASSTNTSSTMTPPSVRSVNTLCTHSGMRCANATMSWYQSVLMSGPSNLVGWGTAVTGVTAFDVYRAR